MKTMTIAELVPLWLTSRSYRPATVRLRTMQLSQLVDVVGDVPPDDVGLDGIVAWWRSTERLSVASRRSAWSAASGFWRWSVAVGAASRNPVDAIRVPPEPEAVPKALTGDQVQALWRITPLGPLRIAVALALGAGLRRTEICNLRGCDVDRDGDPLLLTVTRKGGGQQLLPVECDRLHEELVWRPATRERLVPHTPNGLTNAVKRLLVDAGVEDRSLHSLRHTWATNALRAGMDVRTVQHRLGHRSLLVTHRYLAPVEVDIEGRRNGRGIA